MALLGILSVNIWFFAHPEMLLPGVRGEPVDSAAGQLVRFTVSVLFEGKSYVLFSFLFGLSFALAWARGAALGASPVQHARRRFAALILLGLLHGVFLFAGDILLAYGLLGFLLLRLRRISTAAALVSAGALYIVVVVLLLVLAGAALQADDAAAATGAAGLDGAEQAAAAYTGSASQWLAFQWGAYPAALASVLVVQGPVALAAFLAGLLAGRHRVLQRLTDGEFRTHRLVLTGAVGLVTGLTLSVLAARLRWGPPGVTDYTAGYGAELLGAAVNLAAGPFQACGYAIFLLLLFRSAPRIAGVLAPAGRMTLTHYLGQSLVLAILFSGLGFGWGGQAAEVTVGVVVLGIWLTQLALSHLWLRRFRHGPLELPLRAWTYRGTEPV